MSSALAIAGVSAVLRDLLNDGLIRNNVTAVIGSSIAVSVGPPDRVTSGNGNEATQLNLFLYQATPNSGWRNEGLPARDASGRQRLSNPPLALDLHYMLSAHGGSDLHGEILLGYAMQLLHETPGLSRQAIQAALTPPPPPPAATPLQKALAASGLPDQIEQMKITPEYLGTEEISKLWTATLSHFRPTAAYAVSVVLIQATEPVRTPLPVLSRGQVDPLTHRDRGVVVEAGLLPAVPTLETVEPPGGQPVARLGETIDLKGHHLDGNGRTVLLTNDRFKIEQEIPAIPALAGGGAELIQLSIPWAQATDFPVGVYRVGTRVHRLGEPVPRESNRVALTIAPELIGLPATVAPDGAGTASFTLQFVPALRAGQRATLLLGEQEHLPKPFAGATTTSLDFVIADAPAAPAPGLLARLRIDGIDSPIIDRAAKPPVFRNQRIVIK
jgi:Pvc16 N-terminal domain